MAVPVTTKQMALIRNQEFMERVTATMAETATNVLSEAATTPFHAGRVQYAQRVVSSPPAAATQAGPQVVMGVNVVVTTTYDEATKTSTCTIADLDLQSQIMTLWNGLAGLDTPSS